MDISGCFAQGKHEVANAVNEQGVTLVELLVSLALSAMSFIAAMQFMSTGLHLSSDLEQISSIYDKAQHAMSILGSSVTRAGFLGCGGRSARLSSLLRTDLQSIPELNLEAPYEIHSYQQGSLGLAELPIRVGSASINAIDGGNGIPVAELMDGNDLLIVRGLGFAASVVAAPVAPGRSIKVDSRRSLTRRSFAAITDCETIEVFRITGLGTSSGLSVLRRGQGLGMHDNQASKLHGSQAFSNLEDNRTKVFPIETEIFFIARSRTSEEVPALWRKETHRRPLELIEGVSGLEVTELEDDDGHTLGLRLAFSVFHVRNAEGRRPEHRLVRFFAFENL